MAPTAFVTGATGFVGSHLVRQLADAGWQVTALVRRSSSLQDLDGLAREAGLDVLVEVHDETELADALATHATLVGVNNRDLHTFTTDLGATERLRPLLPEGLGMTIAWSVPSSSAPSGTTMT